MKPSDRIDEIYLSKNSDNRDIKTYVEAITTYLNEQWYTNPSTKKQRVSITPASQDKEV